MAIFVYASSQGQRTQSARTKKKKLQEEIDTSKNIEDENEFTNDAVEIDSDDCEVFKCDIVGYGFTAYKVFDKLRNFKERLDSLNLEWEEENWGSLLQVWAR